MNHSLAPFKQKGFVPLFAAQWISSLGDWVSCIIVPILLYQKTGSAFSVGILVVCRFLPRVLVAPFLGRIHKTTSALKAMICADIVCGIAFLSFLWVQSVFAIYFLNIVLALGTAVFKPCKMTLIAHLMPKELLARVNSYISGIDQLMMLLGPALGGIILGVMGAKEGIIFNSISFFISSLLLLSLVFHRRQSFTVEEQTKESTALSNSFYRRLFFRYPVLCSMILADAITGSSFGSMNALFPVFSKQVFPANMGAYGYIMSALGCGLLLGTLVGPYLEKRIYPPLVFGLSTLWASLSLMGFGQSFLFPLCLLSIFLVGCGNGIQDIVIVTTVQKEGHDSKDTIRLFSFHQAAVSIFIMIALLGTTFLADRIGVRSAIFSISAFAATVALLYFVLQMYLSRKARFMNTPSNCRS